MTNYVCNYCVGPLIEIHDFGKQPIANRLKDANEFETLHNLKLSYCEACDLYQSKSDQTFFDENYPYQSSIAASYIEQCREYYSAHLKDRPKDIVITEIGCNDGYLLKELRSLGFSNLYGFEPVNYLALKASQHGQVVSDFFSLSTFGRVPRSDIVIANNVFAHTQRLQEFVESLKLLVKPNGFVFLEVQDFKKIVQENSWDTIYHEHCSYFTEESLHNVLSKHFYLRNVTPIDSHGGSLRVILQPKEFSDYSFQKKSYEFDCDAWVNMIKVSKFGYIRQLVDWRRFEQKEIACFGASAKGISFLNYLGIDQDTISYCVDETPSKQNRVMPKSKIPIISLGEYQNKKQKPDIMIILSWNFASEIKKKLNHPHMVIKQPNGSFSRV